MFWVHQPTANVLFGLTYAGADTYVEVTVCGRPCEVVGDPQGTGRLKFSKKLGFMVPIPKDPWSWYIYLLINYKSQLFM